MWATEEEEAAHTIIDNTLRNKYEEKILPRLTQVLKQLQLWPGTTDPISAKPLNK